MESYNKKIIVLGTIFLDIKGYSNGDFKTASRNIGRIEYVHGGVGRNVAEDLAGLGLTPVFLSISEDNAFGRDIVKRLKESGVNTDHILNVPEGIGTWMAIFNNDNDVYASISRRQDLSPVVALLEQDGDDIFPGTRGVLVEMDVDEKVVDKAFELSDRYGIDVYGVISNMDVAKKRIDYIRRTRCFVCNRHEAQILFDCKFHADDLNEALEILKIQMLNSGIKCMVVTFDKDGAIYMSLNGSEVIEYGICPAKKVDIADSTGAGDAFFSGVCAGLTDGSDLKTACELGTKMAAVVISTTENVIRGKV